MKPRPKAAPRKPNAFARSSGSVTSAMYARAMVMFPPDSPSITRAANSIARLCATASIAKLTTVPMRLKIRIGPPAESIRERAEHGRGDELRQREGGEQQADDDRRGAERLRVERQQRNDDAEADEIDEDREEDDEQRTRHAPTIICQLAFDPQTRRTDAEAPVFRRETVRTRVWARARVLLSRDGGAHARNV